MTPCPECGSPDVYRYKKAVTAVGSDGPNFLPKLAPGFFKPATMVPVVCAACGLIRIYADEAARRKVESSEHWTRI